MLQGSYKTCKVSWSCDWLIVDQMGVEESAPFWNCLGGFWIWICASNEDFVNILKTNKLFVCFNVFSVIRGSQFWFCLLLLFHLRSYQGVDLNFVPSKIRISVNFVNVYKYFIKPTQAFSFNLCYFLSQSGSVSGVCHLDTIQGKTEISVF